jgi:RNA polymerase sigma factor (sigma-70 family)
MKLRALIPQRQKSQRNINWFALYTEGQQRAFAHYFELLYPGVFIYARKVLGDQEAARRIVLFAFVNAWRQREDFTTQDQLKQFILDTVRESCTTHRLSLMRDHKHAHAGATEKFSLFPGWERRGLHLEQMHKEILAEMLQTLDRLPEDSRWVLHNAIAERKTKAQLAEEWHTTENAAAIRKSRAFKTLLALLTEPGTPYYINY